MPWPANWPPRTRGSRILACRSEPPPPRPKGAQCDGSRPRIPSACVSSTTTRPLSSAVHFKYSPMGAATPAGRDRSHRPPPPELAALPLRLPRQRRAHRAAESTVPACPRRLPAPRPNAPRDRPHRPGKSSRPVRPVWSTGRRRVERGRREKGAFTTHQRRQLPLHFAGARAGIRAPPVYPASSDPNPAGPDSCENPRYNADVKSSEVKSSDLKSSTDPGYLTRC